MRGTVKGNSRLRKRAAKSHLNVFKKEQIHTKTTIMQKEGELQPAKEQKRDVSINSRLYGVRLNYMLCNIDIKDYMSA